MVLHNYIWRYVIIRCQIKSSWCVRLIYRRLNLIITIIRVYWFRFAYIRADESSIHIANAPPSCHDGTIMIWNNYRPIYFASADTSAADENRLHNIRWWRSEKESGQMSHIRHINLYTLRMLRVCSIFRNLINFHSCKIFHVVNAVKRIPSQLSRVNTKIIFLNASELHILTSMSICIILYIPYRHHLRNPADKTPRSQFHHRFHHLR